MSDTKNNLSSLSMGKVVLNVKDLFVMKQFYIHVLGLEIIGESSDSVVLGKSSVALVRLQHRGDLLVARPQSAGLYHFALLFASRADLALTVARILKETPHLFSGSADHLVSEAFYFSDPEGNGIELYFDRDRSEWMWKNNRIKMASLYIDPLSYIQSNVVLEETEQAVQMGHIHLKVGDLQQAKSFYVDIVGFEITAELPGALFVSVNGYHHHLGMNTWESYAAVERDETLGLSHFEIILPDKEVVAKLKSRLLSHGVEFDETDGIVFSDPWNNIITLQ